MDYQYFAAAPQPYPFLGLPPTPAHTGSANSEDYSNSPVRGVPLNLASPISTHPSHSSDQQNASPSSLRASVYPPQHHHSHPFLTQKQEAFDQFQPSFDFNQFNNVAANGIPSEAKLPPPQSQHKSSISSNGNANRNHSFEMNIEMNDDGARRGSNSDDDDNMTPAQSRRKAQNRAA
jgi:hypothetical protein